MEENEEGLNFEEKPSLSVKHQFARFILASAASFIVGKLIESLYDKVVEIREDQKQIVDSPELMS